MTSPYLDKPLRSLAEVEAEREAATQAIKLALELPAEIAKARAALAKATESP